MRANYRPYPNTPTAAERRRQTIQAAQTATAAVLIGIATAAVLVILAAITL